MQHKYFLSIIIFFRLICLVNAQETFRDNFSSVSYNNSDGTQDWSSSPWVESGDSDLGPNSQYIYINNNRLTFYFLYGENIRRNVNIGGATAATLSFSWQTNGLGGGKGLRIQVSSNGGGSFTTVGTVNGNNSSGNFSADISGFISANTVVRFINTGTNWDNNDYAYVDNFQIAVDQLSPEIQLEDITVNEDAGSVTVRATHNGASASGPFTVNYTTADGTALASNDYTATTGVLNFNGISGDTATFSIPITNDSSIEADESFTVNLTGSSNANVVLSDVATITIIDEDAVVMTNGTTSTACGMVFVDSGVTNNYGNNRNETFTICPDGSSDYVTVDFTSFDVQLGDVLYVYQGTTTGGTLIGAFDNNNVPTAISSTDNSGCLTFRFVSNNSNTGAGWEADILCFEDGPIMVIEDVYFDEDIGNAVFTVTHTGTSHTGFLNFPVSFTVDYQTVNGSAVAGSDYTSTSGTLTFNGNSGTSRTISVPIINDGTPENLEFFTVELTGANFSQEPVNFTDSARGYINSQILANDPLTLFKQFDGPYDYAVTGGSLRTQSNTDNACSITDSSSNQLTTNIPNTATISAAYLYWANSGTTRDEQVTFEGQTVNAGFVYQTTLANMNFYGYVSDVTNIISTIPDLNTTTFDFSDLIIDNTGDYCTRQTTLGGWTLMVFYEDENLPAVNINLYQGFDGLTDEGTSFTLDSFFAIAGSGAKATFLSWEGDFTLNADNDNSNNPEALSITNQANQTFPLTGDGGQTGNNAYNSTIYDNTASPVFNSSGVYGLDLDTYDISGFITPGDSQVTANVDMGQDYVINAAVVIKVPSNLISGTVFEDMNYPGGVGRDQATSNGNGVSGAIVELFDSSNNFIERKTTDANGDYAFGGMPDGSYKIKVVNSSVRSNRPGGLNCADCFPVQTFRRYGTTGMLIDVVTEIGGADPVNPQDAALGILTGAKSVSDVTVNSNGVVNIDFGFNFNTIVNTNESGQGSLEQFIINSNTLGEAGLDIESNAIFDPAAEEDTSIFMIPPTGDPLGRTADANYQGGGYFDIFINNTTNLTDVTGTNTIIDGRTQTAYSGDSNSGVLGSGGTGVGNSNAILPNYERPEIQIHRNGGDILDLNGINITIRNVSVYANNNAAIRVRGGSATISNNVLGVNAIGAQAGNIVYGVEQTAGTATITSNYISRNSDAGIYINGGTASNINQNHLTYNGTTACNGNILINNGTGITIAQNLLENPGAANVELSGVDGVFMADNSITGAGQNGGNCSGSLKAMGVLIDGTGNTVSQNRIYTNGEAGIVVSNGTDNTFTQNSIFANGTINPSLGIDLNADAVTLNDNADADTGPNNLTNFPLITAAYIAGNEMVIKGWARPNVQMEFFFTDVNEGTATAGSNQLGTTQDYGEGQLYIGAAQEGGPQDLDASTAGYTDTDGNTDNTNRFHVRIPLPIGTELGEMITATATDGSATSEFSPMSVLKVATVITNRRITYRVNQ